MESLPVNLFNGSFAPFINLLNEYEIKYQIRSTRSHSVMAAGEVLEILKTVGSMTFWPSLAAVLVAFIKSRNTRKVMITTSNKTVVQVEGLTVKEVEELLKIAESITAIDRCNKSEV